MKTNAFFFDNPCHRIIVRNFSHKSTTIFMPLDVSVDPMVDRVADTHFLISAPLGHLSLDNEIRVIFYVDSEPVDRELRDNEFQVVYEAGGPLEETFHQWASSLVEFVRLMFFRLGMVSVDFADFLTVIYWSESKRLRFEKLPYDHHATVPYNKHTGPAYRTLYGCVAAGVGELSLGHFTDLQDACDLHNSDSIVSKIAMTFAEYDPPMMMLLGEPVAL